MGSCMVNGVCYHNFGTDKPLFKKRPSGENKFFSLYSFHEAYVL